MGAQKEFYPRRIDRTAYGACAGVAAIVAAIFLVLAWGVWIGAAYARRHLPRTPLNRPSVALPSVSPTDILQHARDAATRAAQEKLDQAKQAAQEAATQEINEQKEQVKQDASQQLNDYLQR